jgi:diaminopimelate epimerase
MKLEFYKYHGTGNDFILVDNRTGSFPEKTPIIEGLCHRRFGVGGDGLILLNNSENHAFSMRYFNSDGKEGSMCGNGGRCTVALANHLGLTSPDVLFETTDGIHHAIILEQAGNSTIVKLSMNDVTTFERIENYLFLDTGSPHYVLFVEDNNSIDVVKEGRAIRNSSRFRDKGTNVDFVEITGDKLFVRTYERGVEDETFSCGTGVVASAIAYSIMNPGRNEVTVNTLGGTLKIAFNQKENIFTDIWLTGPATLVYKGIINI